MLYGAIKDALMIRYEYSAEWQLISRRRALTAASSMTVLRPYDGTLVPLPPMLLRRERIKRKKIMFLCLCVSSDGGIALLRSCPQHCSATSYLEEDPRAITTYARIMRNGLITQPELGIHYTTHHLQQTSQSNTENLYFPLPRALHPLKQTSTFFLFIHLFI